MASKPRLNVILAERPDEEDGHTNGVPFGEETKNRKARRALKKAGKPTPIKLEIACGQNKTEGFVGIDIAPIEGVDIVHDLWTYPWPIESESVAEARAIHYIEHIPMEYVQHNGQRKDALIAFFDEVYRILIPDGTLFIIAPYYASMRCWQDPTHRRAINDATFMYAWKEWRATNKLDHYNMECDFDFSYGYGYAQDWIGKNDETRAFGARHHNNVVADIHVTLTKRVGR